MMKQFLILKIYFHQIHCLMPDCDDEALSDFEDLLPPDSLPDCDDEALTEFEDLLPPDSLPDCDEALTDFEDLLPLIA